MLLQYDWPGDVDEVPDIGTRVEVSGDPDKPVLRGAIARIIDEDGDVVLSIMMPDGQPGAEEFQVWVANEGDIGLKLADVQGGPV